MVDADVIIIGAGAAGIAAGRACARAGVSYRVLDARDRVGGRAHVVMYEDMPLDLGCGWLHSADRNPLVAEAQALGLEIDQSTPPWQKTMLESGFSLADQRDFRAAQQAFYERLAQAALLPDDYPAAHFLPADEKWANLINAISTYVNGTELDKLSTKDFIAYDDTPLNWRLPQGYGALFAALADGLHISLGCHVSVIDHSGVVIKLVTSQGILQAHKVIISVPPSLVARGDLRFSPELPDHVAAAHVLPLGVADKIYLRLDEAQDFPIDGRLMGAVDRTEKGSYHLRPFGRALIEGYFGGQYARDLEREGPDGFFAAACEEISAALGSAIKKRLHYVTSTAWAQDPLSLGSYSHALPHYAGARKILATPHEARLFFAGEAVRAADFSTAHGAWLSGLEAAKVALAGKGML